MSSYTHSPPGPRASLLSPLTPPTPTTLTKPPSLTMHPSRLPPPQFPRPPPPHLSTGPHAGRPGRRRCRGDVRGEGAPRGGEACGQARLLRPVPAGVETGRVAQPAGARRLAGDSCMAHRRLLPPRALEPSFPSLAPLPFCPLRVQPLPSPCLVFPPTCTTPVAARTRRLHHARTLSGAWIKHTCLLLSTISASHSQRSSNPHVDSTAALSNPPPY